MRLELLCSYAPFDSWIPRQLNQLHEHGLPRWPAYPSTPASTRLKSRSWSAQASCGIETVDLDNIVSMLQAKFPESTYHCPYRCWKHGRKVMQCHVDLTRSSKTSLARKVISSMLPQHHLAQPVYLDCHEQLGTMRRWRVRGMTVGRPSSHLPYHKLSTQQQNSQHGSSASGTSWSGGFPRWHFGVLGKCSSAAEPRVYDREVHLQDAWVLALPCGRVQVCFAVNWNFREISWTLQHLENVSLKQRDGARVVTNAESCGPRAPKEVEPPAHSCQCHQRDDLCYLHDAQLRVARQFCLWETD